LALAVGGCSYKGGSSLSLANTTKVMDSNLTENFPQEDELAIFALDAQNHRKFKEASNYYSKLYEKTNKVIYATEAIKSAVVVKDYDKIKKILDRAEANDQHDATLDSFLVAYYIDKKRFKEAKKLTDKLLQKDRTAKNLELSGLAYEGLGDTQKALRFYEESYNKSQSEYALLKMTDLLYLKLKQKSKATRALETHATMQGCSEIICTRLIQFYAHDKDSRGIENMLTKLYQKTKNPAYAQKLMELYASKKEHDKAIRFLKQSKFDDLLLLDIYTSKKDFQSALTLAETLYEQNGNPALLARSAILEYENAPDKNSKPLLKKVSKKFDTVVEELKDPLYYNYYGYVLIEHELDIDRGIELVKKALKKDPDSAFYIDSLAWGLYKKGDCQQAYEIIKPIAKNHDEQEIVDHINIIQRCAKEAK